ILVLGVVTIGLIPNMFTSPLLTHAAYSISGVSEFEPIRFWHGFETPLIMSLIVVAIGTLLAMTRTSWNSVYNVLPGNFSFNRVYDSMIEKIDTYSEKLTESYMVGSVRTYMGIILIATFIISFIVMYLTNGFVIDFSDLADISILELVVVTTIVVAAVGTILSNHNVAAILILGIVGYGVAILFVLYRAPDIALTQLVIETVTVALFLLCFYHFPNLRRRNESKGTIAMNLFISAGFGLLM